MLSAARRRAHEFVVNQKEVIMAVMEKWSEDGVRRREDMAMERARTAYLASHLSSVALRQWEKSLTGIIALPAAAALGVAATATYGVALIERGFEVLESAVGEVGRVLTTAEKREGNNDRRPDHPEARS
jgi:hypothetical protein